MTKQRCGICGGAFGLDDGVLCGCGFPIPAEEETSPSIRILRQLEANGIESSDDTLGVVVRQALRDDPRATWQDVRDIWAEATAEAAANREREARA